MKAINQLNDKPFITVQFIKKWINENWEYYKDIKDNWNCENCPTELGLPCICINPEEEYVFTLVYEKLDEVISYHKSEEYFRKELIIFENIKDSENELREWVLKNQKLWDDGFFTIGAEFFDFDFNNKETANIRVFRPRIIIPGMCGEVNSPKLKRGIDFEIYVDRNDFKHTLKFLEIFSELS